jgi:hypothetical protein
LVHELDKAIEVAEHIRRNKLAGIVITNKRREELWSYVVELLNRLESSSQPRISFALVHYETLQDSLKSFEIEIARKSALIKLYLDGNCVFEQEGLLGSKLNDEIALKRGIRESLKLYSINMKFKAE